MRDQAEAPADFVSYVDSRLPALEAAAHRLSGDDLQAERLSQDLLALVALRWRKLGKADAQHGLDPGESADVYLSRLFRQEALDQGAPQVPLRLDIPVPGRRRRLTGRLTAADEAGVIWERARRTIRRRLIIAAGAGGLLAIFAICQRGRGGNAPTTSLPEAAPTVLPSGAELAPANPGSGQRLAGVPSEIAVPEGELPALSADPVRRATLLMSVSHTDTSPIVVLGDDGRWRRVDVAPALAALWLHAGALSPDGLRAAFGTSSGTTVVDLATGKAMQYSATPEPTRPIWLGPRHLLMGVKTLLNVDTGKSGPVPAIPDDAVTPQHYDPAGDPAARLVELLSVGVPTTAGARIRRWTPAGAEQVTPISGPLAELIGPWRGGGFGYGGDDGLLARVCLATSAVNVASAASVVAVVRAKTGRVERTLLVDPAQSGGVRIIGWADSKRLILSLTRQNTLLVAWDVVAGGVTMMSTVRGDGILAFPDLTSAA